MFHPKWHSVSSSNFSCHTGITQILINCLTGCAYVSALHTYQNLRLLDRPWWCHVCLNSLAIYTGCSSVSLGTSNNVTTLDGVFLVNRPAYYRILYVFCNRVKIFKNQVKYKSLVIKLVFSLNSLVAIFSPLYTVYNKQIVNQQSAINSLMSAS